MKNIQSFLTGVKKVKTTNKMKDLYKHFGKKKEDNQEMHSIANIFYEMGKEEEQKKSKREEMIKELLS